MSQYTRLNLLEVDELDYGDYLQYRRDAFIDALSKTEEGQQYLNDAWRLEQVKPDKGSLRKNFRKEG